MAWQFPPAMGDSYPGQQSTLVLLRQQSRMPMREQRFLICYKEMLAIETTITSANSWNSCFHQNSGNSSSPCFARTAVHLNLLGQRSRTLMSEQQFLIFHNEMLTIKTTVSSANLLHSHFHKPRGESSSPCFATTAVHFNCAETTSGKQGQQFLYKQMAQDKDRCPLQFAGTAVPYAYE